MHNVSSRDYYVQSIHHRYLSDTYSPYYAFLDGSASLEIDNFLKSGEHELGFFAKVRNFDAPSGRP